MFYETRRLQDPFTISLNLKTTNLHSPSSSNHLATNLNYSPTSIYPIHTPKSVHPIGLPTIRVNQVPPRSDRRAIFADGSHSPANCRLGRDKGNALGSVVGVRGPGCRLPAVSIRGPIASKDNRGGARGVEIGLTKQKDRRDVSACGGSRRCTRRSHG